MMNLYEYKSELYETSRHLRGIQSMADRWNLPLDPSVLPKHGRIVAGKAAIFLYKTDSNVGFLENLICNRDLDKEDVSKAINACVEEIEKDAKRMGIRLLICSTDINAVVNRATQTFGYAASPKTMLYKELK